MRRHLVDLAFVVVAIILFCACGYWRLTAPEWSPWHTANAVVKPQSVKTQSVYQLFMPLFQTQSRNPGIGLASTTRLQSNADKSDADWYYYYGWCSSPCVPAILHYRDIVSSCPPTLMLWNEPEVPFTEEQGWQPITPTLAALRSQQIRAQCPATKLISGNTMQETLWWTDEYLAQAQGGQADYIGTHCYTYALAQTCIDIITAFRDHFAYAGKPICVTEWNVLLDAYVEAEFPKYMYWLTQNIPCSAVYSDRQYFYPWDANIDVSLVDARGNLTQRGLIFAGR